MKSLFFDQQWDRLKTRWPNVYVDEMKKIVYSEVANFSDAWFKKTIDEFIGNERYAPLLNRFREECAKERERLHTINKWREKKDAEEFFSNYGPEDKKSIMLGIKKRLVGGVNDAEWEDFLETLPKIESHDTRGPNQETNPRPPEDDPQMCLPQYPNRGYSGKT